MAISLTAETIRAQELGDLAEADIGRATGAAPEMVRAWLTGSARSTGTQDERLHELASAVERLSRLIRRDAIAPWLRTSIPLLGGATPLDAIAAGDGREVARLISGLEDPGAS